MQFDEKWSFVAKKEKHCRPGGPLAGEEGDNWDHVAVDPEQQVTVCCGATEAMISSLLAVVNPGEEVVIFEPFYENYGPDSVISGIGQLYERTLGEQVCLFGA